MITDLTGKIGSAQLRRLLRNAEPEFREEYAALLEQIRQQNQDQVIRLAHSLKNTAALFECQSLVSCLKKVEQGDMALIVREEFQQQLEQAHQDCLARLSFLGFVANNEGADIL